jgi:TolA-binding protein
LAPPARFWKAETLYHLGRFADAADLLSEMSRQPLPEELADEVRYNLAWSLVRLGRPDEAIEHFSLVAEESRDETLRVAAICRIGDTYLEKGEADKAIDYYDMVLAEYPKSVNADYAQYQSAETLLRLQRADAAALSFQSLLVNYPSSRWRDEAMYGLGTALMRSGNTGDAVQHFRRLVAVFPESPLKEKAYFQTANCHFNRKEWDKALEIYRDLVARAADPEIARLAKVQIGWVRLKQGDDAGAIREFDEYLAAHPQSDITPDVLFGLGEHHFNRGQYAKAREYYQRIFGGFPGHTLRDDARFRGALALERESGPPAALEEYRAIAVETPDSRWAGPAAIKAADVLLAQGRSDEAKAELLRVIGGPQPPAQKAPVRQKLAGILRGQGFLREAAIAYAEALREAPPALGAEIQYGLAEVYETQGEAEKAAAEFMKLAYVYPDSDEAPRARWRAAEIFEQANRREEAVRIYEKIASTPGRDADAAREKIRKLTSTQSR